MSHTVPANSKNLLKESDQVRYHYHNRVTFAIRFPKNILEIPCFRIKPYFCCLGFITWRITILKTDEISGNEDILSTVDCLSFRDMMKYMLMILVPLRF